MNQLRNTWEFFSTKRIVFGEGAIRKLGAVLTGLNAVRILLITDSGLRRSGIVDRLVDQLALEGFEVVLYDQAVPEPPVQAAVDCSEFARNQAKIDAIVGLGGGSSIDLAKVVALLLAHGGNPLQYAGEHQVPGPILPLVAIPTTAGTGSEVTSVAVLTDEASQSKVGISDQHLRPEVALLDPELTLGLPPYVTACSGIDALAHAIEAYMAMDYKYIQAEGNILFQGALPLSDVLALDAIRRIGRHLVKAVRQGCNLEARTQMMLGSLLAGMAFSNAGTASAHALAYPIGGLTKSPHGEVTGLLLPYVMKFNAVVQREKLRNIADALQIRIDRRSDQEVEAEVFTAMIRLLKEIGLPTSLSEIGIDEANIPEIAVKALGIERLIRNNPRIPTAKDFEALLLTAL